MKKTMTEKFKPYIPSEKVIPEFSLKALFLGLFLGVVFAIANAYLALKVGTTVSASIPAAILAMGIFRFLAPKSTVLETNLVQTIATVGEGLAAGVTFTIPALLFLGEIPSIYQIFLLSSLGGILGILFMIPMRRHLIVEEHETLPFPEGSACAKIIESGEKSKSSAFLALWGVCIGALYKLGSNIFFLWQEIYTIRIPFLYNTVFSMDATPSLLGVGYLIGARICSLMFAGGILAWWVFIPLIRLFGEGNVIIYPSLVPISTMDVDAIWSNYIRYIGAGCVGIGGLLGLLKIAPILFKSAHSSFSELFSGLKIKKHPIRTDKDISLTWLFLGSVASIFILWLYPGFPMNFFTIILLIVLGFFFVAVTSITVGLVGSTSNPVSGMTITTLLITCLCFVALGWTERIYLISAITMSCVASIAICMAGTTSQDLKTGFLLGATPRSQQIAEIIGVFLPSFALGGTLYLLNEVYQIGSPNMPAPQAALISMIADGVISGKLPYGLVGIGVVLGFILHFLKLPVIPFALGLYLPLSLSSATMLGGIVAWGLSFFTKSSPSKEKGTLFASGLIGGDACTGIVIASLAVSRIIPLDKKAFFPPFFTPVFFGLLALFLFYVTTRKSKQIG